MADAVADDERTEELLAAAGSGDVAAVRRLLAAGVDVNAKNDDDDTALIMAAQWGHFPVVELLVENGADVNAHGYLGYTALSVAALGDHLAVAALLLEKGANVHAKDDDGFTALYVAAENGHHAVAALLLEKGANVHAKNDDGFTALYVAAQNGHPAVVELLLENGAEVNAKEKTGHTALVVAAEEGHPAVVDVLLRQEGVEVNATDINGLTLLHRCAARCRKMPLCRERADHRAVVELLATHGADVTAEDNEGWTPIHRAALPGRDEYGDTVEPDVGIINYLLRETGAIVPLAQTVVDAHYRRQKRIVHGLRGAVDNPGFFEDLADTLDGVDASSCAPGIDAKLKSLLRQIAEAAGDGTGAQEANRAPKRVRREDA